jgi:phosphatidylinositol kinase/protein kinase (PI-3  family)
VARLLRDVVAMSGAEQLLIPAMPGIGDGASNDTVVGFGKSVHVFSSKQAPKKLTIFGSDFASHDW